MEVGEERSKRGILALHRLIFITLTPVLSSNAVSSLLREWLCCRDASSIFTTALNHIFCHRQYNCLLDISLSLQMLINQSNQLLQYYDHSPIRLLSLPIEQNDMIQRLKSFKQRRRKNSTHNSNHHYNLAPHPSPYLSSFRLEQPQDQHAIERQNKPSSKSVELATAIHSKNTQGRLLTIVKEGNGKRKSSVLKHLIQHNTPSNRSKVEQSSSRRLAVTRLQKIEKKGETSNEAVTKIYRSQLQRRRKEKQLRNVLIISRVRQSKHLSLVVRRLSTLKTVPI